MMEVTQGATIVGKSGRQLVVERVEGEVISCADGTKVRRERVIDVIPPPQSHEDD